MLIKGKRRHGLLSDDPDIAKLLTVGMVFQNGALFDSLTVGQNVGFLLYEHTKLAHRRVQVCFHNTSVHNILALNHMSPLSHP